MTKPGRNDRCPCGSGKKYKHCHGSSVLADDVLIASASSDGRGAPPRPPRADEMISLAPTVVRAITGGNRPEPPVSNVEYLESYVRFGLWMRVLSAYNHMLAVEKSPKDGLSRIASVAGLMEQHGMFLEDATSMVIVLCAWAKRRDRLIPDLLRDLNLKNGPLDMGPMVKPYHDVGLDALVASRRGTINPRQFFRSTKALSVESQACLLGIRWPDDLAAVPDDEQRRWRTLEDGIATVFDLTGQGINQIAAMAYNKIKHGPQAVVCNMRSVAMRRDVHQSLVDHLDPTHLHLRLLFAGARTQEAADDTGADGPKPVAPYVPDDDDNVLRLMFRMLGIASGLQSIVGRLLYSEFGRTRTPPRDPDLAAMCTALAARLEALPPERQRHEREVSIQVI